MMRARLALLLAVTALVTASAVIAQTLQSVQQELAPDGWTDVRRMSGDSVGWFGGLMNRSNWNNPASDCTAVESGANRLFSEAHWYIGDNASNWGEYYPDVTLANGDTIQIAVFDRGLWNNPAIGLETLLHEGAHHVGYTHTGAFDAYDAESCAVLKPKEEEEPGGPNNGGGDPDPENCTETQEWVPAETVPVFVKPESTTLEGGPPVPTKHTAVPIPGITVGVKAGRWVEKVIKEGYWKTVKECTNS
jgi:hypothetical protein